VDKVNVLVMEDIQMEVSSPLPSSSATSSSTPFSSSSMAGGKIIISLFFVN
jgi:hypothetical protein